MKEIIADNRGFRNLVVGKTQKNRNHSTLARPVRPSHGTACVVNVPKGYAEGENVLCQGGHPIKSQWSEDRRYSASLLRPTTLSRPNI